MSAETTARARRRATKGAKVLVVPIHCGRGHELSARTTFIATDGVPDPTGWHCVRCVRLDAWNAHYRGSESAPEELLAETQFNRQTNSKRGPGKGWTDRVRFLSGFGYKEPDPTPARRELRETA
ncbi:hypothetical protein [Rhodococcus sp. 1139]|uniref:hypothetical protein n=1 Tax=Rhodococcus sp. 1139 TaxID=1833762 RepID=UPI00114C8912|nr:hypothetical protein [Rhodococcus sp. 1139]